MRNGLILIVAAFLLSFSACRNDILLDERFEDNRLLNWKVMDEPSTIEGPSDWRVEQDGWLHQRSNIWGPRGDFINRWYGTLIVAGEDSWGDYTFTVKARPEDSDGFGGDGFGVVFRFRDPQHFYRLLFIEDGMNGGPITRLDKREGADYTELWSAEKGYDSGAEMLIQIEVNGDTIRGYAGGTSLFEVKDGQYRRGKIGLFCFAQSSQAFDDVKVIRH